MIGACLGDLYSVNWMEDSDAQGEGSSLEQQYEKVVKLTNKSHPTISLRIIHTIRMSVFNSLSDHLLFVNPT